MGPGREVERGLVCCVCVCVVCVLCMRRGNIYISHRGAHHLRKGRTLEREREIGR